MQPVLILLMNLTLLTSLTKLTCLTLLIYLYIVLNNLFILLTFLRISEIISNALGFPNILIHLECRIMLSSADILVVVENVCVDRNIFVYSVSIELLFNKGNW